MSTSVNIFNIKINNISNNGSVNIGDNFSYGHAAHTKSTGANSSYGDYAPPKSLMKNIYIDPDVNDQGEVANPTHIKSDQK